jgi:hypothetical protein
MSHRIVPVSTNCNAIIAQCSNHIEKRHSKVEKQKENNIAAMLRPTVKVQTKRYCICHSWSSSVTVFYRALRNKDSE